MMKGAKSGEKGGGGEVEGSGKGERGGGDVGDQGAGGEAEGSGEHESCARSGQRRFSSPLDVEFMRGGRGNHFFHHF